MTRLQFLVYALLVFSPAFAQQKPQESKPAQPQPEVVEQEPPEEDKTYAKREYGFNPLQAIKEIKVGLFYMKKGSYRAALGRFEEATRWNPNNAEAWLRVAEAQEKLKDEKAAKEAYAKYLELDPDGKFAAAARKKASSSGSGGTK